MFLQYILGYVLYMPYPLFLMLACGLALLLYYTVHPKKYAHGFVVLCFVVVMQSFIMNSHEVFIHIHLGCFAGTGTIVRLPQCQWSKPDGYGKISQCITTTKHSEAETVCIFLGIYCMQVCIYFYNADTFNLLHLCDVYFFICSFRDILFYTILFYLYVLNICIYLYLITVVIACLYLSEMTKYRCSIKNQYNPPLFCEMPLGGPAFV